ncbi:MAG: hypothetical protein ACM3RX_00915 [Methanococcaceae archaeon]
MTENAPYPAFYLIKNTSVEDLLLHFLLPGTGEKTKEECNTITHADYCPDCHNVEPHYYHCKNFLCPECYKWAAWQAATKAADYLYGCAKAWRAIGLQTGFVNHIELSVPESQYEEFDEKKTYAKAIRYAVSIGIFGGGMVFHAFRIKEEYQRPIQQALSALGKKMGSWEAAIHHNILGLPSVAGYLYFSPHYHVVGHFKLKEKSSKFYKKSGWTYTNISIKKHRGCESQKAVKNIYSYLLTHHAHKPGKQSIHYFGICAKNKVQREIWKTKEDKKCICGGQMYRIAIWTEERVEQIRRGEWKIELDDFNPKSKKIIVHNFYRVRTTQTEISTFYEDKGS